MAEDIQMRKSLFCCKTLGVPRGEIIYFTVDYDFVKYEVNEKYFHTLKVLKIMQIVMVMSIELVFIVHEILAR